MVDVPLEAKVAFLRNPNSYPHAPASVVAKETHWAWVFIASGLVYKMKKPCLRPSMDFRDLASRRRACENELLINQRLAPGVYRSLVPLVQHGDGSLTLGGHGSVVEWLVEMSQLETANCMDARLLAKRLTPVHVDAVARRFADFYKASLGRRLAGHADTYLSHLWMELHETRRILPAMGSRYTSIPIGSLIDAVERGLSQAEAEIRDRAASGLVVDGHGDLRPEHVCIGDGVIAFDALEFDDTMRLIDPYDELNYLGLECEVLGADWVRPILLNRLQETIGSRPSSALMGVYGAFRALLRARICLAHLLDEKPMTPDLWPGLSERYLRCAERELAYDPSIQSCV